MLKRLNLLLAALLLAVSVVGALPPSLAAAAPKPLTTTDPKDPAAGAAKGLFSDEQLAAGASKPPTPTPADKPTVGKHGTKGMPSLSAKHTQSSDVATLLAGTYYWYNSGSQNFTSGTLPTGVYANYTVSKPIMAAGDYHSLAEIAVIKTVNGQRQIVEVGWSVDPALYGDSNPHLFGFYWVNGVPQCYNGCGFVDYAANTTNLGATLTPGPNTVGKKFGIQFDTASNAWWLSYDNQWLGYYPSTLWTGASPAVNGFTNADNLQLFGEVAAASNVSTCTDMGNALHGTNTAAATIGSTTYVGLPTSSVNLTVFEQTPVGSYPGYTEAALSARTLRYGGPGC